MATLTTDQEQWLRRQVGTTIELTDLQTRYDRLGDLVEVAREVLEQRLADFSADPAQFDVTGTYSQNTGANIKALQDALAALGTDEEHPSASTLRSVQPSYSPTR